MSVFEKELLQLSRLKKMIAKQMLNVVLNRFDCVVAGLENDFFKYEQVLKSCKTITNFCIQKLL